jgi:tripartite ATP-independent transporter DctP family solute receptor
MGLDKHFNFICVLILSILFVIFASSPCFAKRILKLGHIDPDDPFIAPDQAASVVFKNMVDTGTNGEIEVQVFPSSILGKERESMEMVKNGLLQGYLASAGSMASFWPLVGILDTPFAIPNFSIAYDVFDGWFGEKLKRSFFEKTGIRCLEITDASGFFNFTNNKRQIRSVEDVKGIKFRSMALPSHMAFFRALGASAIPISWAEVYTSLQTGVVDGQHNPLGQIIQNKIYEVQKYLSLTNHIFSTHWFLTNEDFFRSLSSEQQKIVTDAALVAKVASRGITRIVASTDKGIPLLAKRMEIYQPTAKEKEAFAAVVIPAMRSFIKNYLGDEGVALQNDFLKAIEESKKKLGY